MAERDNNVVSLFRVIREDWINHNRDWTLPGFRAIAICRFGQWRMQIQSKILRAPFSLLYRFLYRRARNIYGIELPYSVKLGQRVRIEHQGGVVIHGCAEIGDDCIIRQGVTLGNRYMDRPEEAPIIGNAVNIGAGAKILGNVNVGHRSKIGANAVVLIDVPEDGVAVGNPAKLKQPHKE
jgi:serine O-acetyltransferase